MAGEVGAHLLVQHRRARLQRLLDVDDGRERLVVHHHRFGRVLGQVAIAGDDDGDGLADEAHLVGGGRIVMDGRGDADAERLARLGHLGAGERADHALHGQRRAHVPAADARMRVR